MCTPDRCLDGWCGSSKPGFSARNWYINTYIYVHIGHRTSWSGFEAVNESSLSWDDSANGLQTGGQLNKQIIHTFLRRQKYIYLVLSNLFYQYIYFCLFAVELSSLVSRLYRTICIKFVSISLQTHPQPRVLALFT